MPSASMFDLIENIESIYTVSKRLFGHLVLTSRTIPSNVFEEMPFEMVDIIVTRNKSFSRVHSSQRGRVMTEAVGHQLVRQTIKWAGATIRHSVMNNVSSHNVTNSD